MSIAGFVVADPPQAWSDAGFTVDQGGTCRIGGVRISLVGSDRGPQVGPESGRGIIGWVLRADQPALGDIDGVPTTITQEPPSAPAVHPNGVTDIDHAVLMTPDLDRTVAALAVLDLQPRRERDAQLGGSAVRQVFYRCGEVVLEVIGSPEAHGEGPARLWGLTHTVTDLMASAASLGEAAGRVKDAVQPGRQIMTLRHRDLGMSVPTALISRREPQPVAPGPASPGTEPR